MLAGGGALYLTTSAAVTGNGEYSRMRRCMMAKPGVVSATFLAEMRKLVENPALMVV
ncbi:MAG: hypothetical protein ACAH88_19160 [Roseimicrobium sp.]